MTINDLRHLGEWNDIEKMTARMRAEAAMHPGTIVSAHHGAWTFCYSEDPQSGRGSIFSAKLIRSSSKERDWLVLGRVAKLIGVPDDHPVPSTIATSPELSHYWRWGGDSVPRDTFEKITALGRAAVVDMDKAGKS
jgi:hypothetical protein